MSGKKDYGKVEEEWIGVDGAGKSRIFRNRVLRKKLGFKGNGGARNGFSNGLLGLEGCLVRREIYFRINLT